MVKVVRKIISSNTLKEKGDMPFYILNTIVLIFALLCVLYPLIYIISASFSSPSAVSSGKVWLWPVEFSIEGYQAVSSHRSIITGFSNSIFYAVLGTMINLVLTIAAAYPLSRKEFKSRNIYMVFFVFAMFFNGGLIPNYILMSQLHLLNKRAVMLLCSGLSVYNMIITRTFFQSNISDELIDAAKIDGLNNISILFKIVLPLSKSIIAVITLFYAVGHWNSYFNAFIYLNDRSKYPLQLVLREILVLNTIDFTEMSGDALVLMMKRQGLADLLKYSLIVVSTAPLLILYPFIQKYFVKGIMIGSLKG